MADPANLKLSRPYFFILLALVIMIGLASYLYLGEGVGLQDKTLGTSLWGKRSLASSWTAEFEGEVKALSSSEVILKIDGEEITIPLDSQTTFLERKSVKIKGGGPAGFDFESKPLVPDDFDAQTGKTAQALLMLVDNDLKGVQVQIISLE